MTTKRTTRPQGFGLLSLGGVKASADFNCAANRGRNWFKQTPNQGVASAEKLESASHCTQNTEYNDFIINQAKQLYKNQNANPEEINMQYDALKRKDIFKEITNIAFDTFVAYRHLIAIAITFQNDKQQNVEQYLKKYGLY